MLILVRVPSVDSPGDALSVIMVVGLREEIALLTGARHGLDRCGSRS